MMIEWLQSKGWKIAPLLLFVLLIGIWEIAARTSDPLLVPSPMDTANSILDLARSGELWQELAVSLRRVAIGVVFGMVGGVPFGILLGSSRHAEALMGSMLPIVSATSSAIWAVLGLLWFGLSDSATVFVIAMTAAPLSAVNMRDGVRATDAELQEMARTMGFGSMAITWKIILPAVLPSLFAGLRLAISFGWRVGLVAEALGSPSGVGFKLKQSVDLMHTPEVFAWSISVIVVMLILEWALLDPLEAYVFRWRKPLNRVAPGEQAFEASTEGLATHV
jgi:NitT/TauT family transport system permease protein